MKTPQIQLAALCVVMAAIMLFVSTNISGCNAQEPPIKIERDTVTLKAKEPARPFVRSTGRPTPKPDDRLAANGDILPLGAVFDRVVEPAQNKEIPFETRQVDRKIESVFIIVNADKLNQCIMIGNTGEWLADVKEFSINMTMGDPASVPVVRCTVYKGTVRPQNPQVYEWKIDRLLTTNDEQFTSILNSMGDGKFPKFE